MAGRRAAGKTCLVWQGRAGTLPALSKPRGQKHLHGSRDIQIYPLRDFTGFFQHALPCLTGPFWQNCPWIRSRSFWAKSGDDGVRLCRGDVWPLWAPGPRVLLLLACHGYSLSCLGQELDVFFLSWESGLSSAPLRHIPLQGPSLL